MKRASYKEAVMWIGLNDEDGASERLDADTVAGYISTTLVADIFGVPSIQVAEAIVAFRMNDDRLALKAKNLAAPVIVTEKPKKRGKR